MATDSPLVLARTASIQFTVRFPSLLPWQRVAAGEKLPRVNEGEGRMLVCTTPFWQYKIMQQKAANPDAMLA